MSTVEKLKKLLLLYPGLHHNEKSNTTSLYGTIKVQHHWYHLQLICPQFPQLNDMNLKLQKLHEMLQITADDTRINSKWNVFDLIENLSKFFVENSVSNTATEQTSVSSASENIYAEIATLYAPYNYQIQLDEHCTRIRFSKFHNNEQHYLELHLPTLKIKAHSLPDCVAWEELLQKYDSLTTLLQQFQKYLEELRPFYENFIDIDELCYVVKPTQPTTKHNWRVFLLRERVFLKLTLSDPFAPVASMSLNIIGPTYEVEQLRRTLSDGLQNWDAELDIHKNLLRIFDLCFFPMITTTASDAAKMLEQFCSICFCCQMDDGEIPIISCDNINCNLIFHALCLKEWFKTLFDGKTFLDVAFGSCPHCKTKLSTSFAELLELNGAAKTL